ncbi:bleomycin resistance protein [Aeromicrobium sp. Root495]|uniref:VOC family protein n=1 Tax=Aeromicrobium sp. Root495 TaxID=1736550 RepID=UPI000702237C|nr:VOC family protein [Aeromicrobium sp. Root495]KQY59256.1 bleomycin resistance protein [Aeromicrobium sp. Root495]
MTSNLAALAIDARDPERLLHFWGGVLEREVVDGTTLAPAGPHDFPIDIWPSEAPKPGPNQMHLDLTSSSVEDQQAVVERVLRFGGSHLDIGQGDVDHVVMADPEGNELCVIEPWNSFLAGCPRIGALSSDGTQAVGYFWSAVLGWPLVWDQDEETAIQSSAGGTKITWGGPPVEPKLAKNRFHLDVAPPAGADQQAEVARLESLGARRIDIGQGDVSWVVMADPDGNELCVLTPR